MNLELALSFNDVLLVPQLSSVKSRTDVDLSTKIAPDISLKIPLISVNMDTVTGVEMAIAMWRLGGIGFLPRFDPLPIQIENIKKIKEAGAEVIASLGIKDGYMEKAEALINAGALAITIDVAHAHTTRTLEVVKNFKSKFPKVSLIVGTVATEDGAFDLFEAGADTVRVGVGAGTICTTRIVAGSGVPQITAINDGVKAKRLFKDKYIIADGGMTTSGDLVKALACGADAVCCGSLFAGTDEAPGKIVSVDGAYFKEYNGSTSKTEKENQVGKDSDGKKPSYTIHVEGVEGMVKYKGPVKNVVEELCAGLKSGFSYSGAHKLEELWTNAKFIRISSAGLYESKAHDIILR